MAATTEVKIYDTVEELIKTLAKEIYILTINSTQAQFHIVLSGGSSPIALFKRIRKKYAESINWQRIHFWWGDERCVAPDDEQSNFKSANDILLSHISIPPENIHRMKGENNPEDEAKRYADEIMKNVNHRGDNPVFDLVILGLGDDGHTASIFPGQLELFEEKQICMATQHPITGQNRITLTGNAINNANRIFFLVTGKNKAQRIAEIMNDDEAAKLLPAYYVSPKNGSLIWFIDEAAGSKMK